MRKIDDNLDFELATGRGEIMELTSQNGDYYLERRNDLVELGLMERDNYIPLD